MKISGYLILFSTIFFTWLIAQNVSTDFRLSINSDKSLYMEGESIWIKVELTNVSADNKYIYDLNNDSILSEKFLDFTITNSQNEIIAYVRERAADWPKITLNANGSVYNYFDLPNYFGNSITNPYLGRRYLPEDTYQCTATFMLNNRTARIESNTISFKVRQTTEPEQSVFQNFIRAYRTWLFDFNDSEAILIYQDILVKNPQSVFATLSSYYINKISRFSDQLTRDGIESSLDFMDKYPDSPFAYKVAKLVPKDAYESNRLETVAARIDTILPKMENHFPRISKMINNRLNQYQSD